ncbi:CD225/dispanin family protein [Calothrix sp. CCY 0018]|uniref:CD225/dispanin family protein n=1 Tax=Calothrix sp. CCY 0018 TaxID=3103864 RepID=UPI0039C70EA9
MSNSGLPKVPNHLTLSILAIFLCMPTAIMAIINSARVNRKLLENNYQEAVLASERCKKWLRWSLILAFIQWPITSMILSSG